VQLAGTWLAETGRVAADDQIWLWVGLGAASVAGSALLGRLSDLIGKRLFVLATSAVLVGCFLMLAREPGGATLAWVGALLAVTAAARTGPLQALVSGVVAREEVPSLMALRGFAMQAGVGLFAVAATPVGEELGFGGVLWLGAGCQAASYLAIRLFAREGR
jgi:predicted MFS family arabinose efflux permease